MEWPGWAAANGGCESRVVGVGQVDRVVAGVVVTGAVVVDGEAQWPQQPR